MKFFAALLPPIVPADGQEATAEPPANCKEAMAQPPPIVPEPPQTGEPSHKGTMPMFVPLPASGITPAENPCYPERRNRSPYFTPPKVIKASSLGKGHNMTPLDVRSPDGATLEQILYAEVNISGEDEASHDLSGIDIDSKDGDYCDPGEDEADDDGSQSSAMEAGGKETGGNLKERAAAVLFQYSNDDYNHLYDEDIDEDEKRIENSNSNKRVKVGRGRVNLIPGGPTLPNCDGMTADEADAAKKRYSIDRQKFRKELCRERLRAAKGGLFDDKDYTGDVTPTLRPIAQVINFHLKKRHTFSDRNLIVLRIAEEANCRGISFQTDKSDELKLYCRGPNSFLVYATDVSQISVL